MSLIACTSDCVYQQDGYCALERAASCGSPSTDEPCVNFVPRTGNGGDDGGLIPMLPPLTR